MGHPADDLIENIDPDFTDDGIESALLSRIPLQSGSTKTAATKAVYLSHRAEGFPVRQACQLANITEATVRQWRRTDSEFADLEANRLPELQATVGDDSVKLLWRRNFVLKLRHDFRLLWKALLDPESMSPWEKKRWEKISSHYTSQELMTVTRALAPEKTDEDYASMIMRITETRAEIRIEGNQEVPKLIEANAEAV